MRHEVEQKPGLSRTWLEVYRKDRGIKLIAEERRRQVREEGWSSSHDDCHADGELARAAAAYALPEQMRAEPTRMGDGTNFEVIGPLARLLWPWDDYYKPSPDNRVRELVKAGALIAAEIDRLQRQAK